MLASGSRIVELTAMEDRLEHVEFEFLSACALRFDGWKYEEAARFPLAGGYHRYIAANGEYGTVEERMAIFFLIQRALGKDWWSYTDEVSGAFRSLFLQVCDAEVPTRFRLNEHARYQRWCEEDAHQVEVWKARVREAFFA